MRRSLLSAIVLLISLSFIAAGDLQGFGTETRGGLDGCVIKAWDLAARTHMPSCNMCASAWEMSVQVRRTAATMTYGL